MKDKAKSKDEEVIKDVSEIEKGLEDEPEEKEETEKFDEKKTTRVFLIAIIALIIVFALIFSVKYFYSKEESLQEYKYGAYKFTKIGGMWYTQIQNENNIFNIPLHYNPGEVKNISVVGKIDDRFNFSKSIYLTSDPAESGAGYIALAAAELSLNMVQGLGLLPVAACSENKTIYCAERPIINCTNTDEPVIYLKENDKAEVELKGNCVVINGKDVDLVRSTDRLLYQLYRIMK
ncbi:MAG: hypothetical protein Q7J54_03190 [Candidatus Woesearchaeota archaeon]|nr:hypothetical protein [Candidatus Woesearchaeota archaeon]